MKKLLFIMIVLNFSLLFADVKDLININFNHCLSNEQKSELFQTRVLIKNVRKASNLAILPVNTDSQRLLNIINELKPNYLAEIIRICDCKPDDKVIQSMFQVLCDIPSYKGIPYWSVENQQWFELYSSAEINSIENLSQNTLFSSNISASLLMNPFETIDVNIKVTKTNDSLYYENINTNRVIFSKIPIIKVGNMRSVIVVYKYGEHWILYGCCGAVAPRFPGFTKRIETAFLNRIKTFVNFVFDKI